MGTRYYAVALALAAGAILIACGGGGGGGGGITAAPAPPALSVTGATPTPSPTPTQTPAPGATPTLGPTPTPSPTPTPPPAGVLSVNPSTMSFQATGAGYAQMLSVEEGAYSGAFTETDTCAGIATIAQTGTSGIVYIYTATAVAAGTCNAKFSDAAQQSQTIGVTVTTTAYTVQSRGKK